jgi:hypothetical protein
VRFVDRLLLCANSAISQQHGAQRALCPALPPCNNPTESCCARCVAVRGRQVGFPGWVLVGLVLLWALVLCPVLQRATRPSAAPRRGLAVPQLAVH